MTKLRWRRRKRGFEAERALLEERTSSLVGEVLAGVRYVVIDPEWDASEDFDSLDFGVELILSSGRVVGLTWDDAIEEFGMSVADGEVSVHRSPESVLEVSTSSRWASLIGHEITASRVIWKRQKQTGTTTSSRRRSASTSTTASVCWSRRLTSARGRETGEQTT